MTETTAIATVTEQPHALAAPTAEIGLSIERLERAPGRGADE